MIDPPPIKLPQMHSNTKLCYTDASGNKYYEFIDDFQMPYKRFVTAQLQDRYVRFGLTVGVLETMHKACERMALDASVKPEQLRKFIMTLGLNIEQRLGYMAGEDAYMQLAGVFYLIEGEPLEPEQGWFQKKKDIWHNDPEAKDFFLLGAFRKSSGLAQTSIEDMKTFFQVAEQREAIIPTLSNPSESGLTASMNTTTQLPTATPSK